MKTFTILLFGDVVGKIGRRALIKILPDLRERYTPDFIAVNVENLAHGRGITPKTLQELRSAGIDAFTSGHHVWENETGLPLLSDSEWPMLIRPANVDPSLSGKGFAHFTVKGFPLILLNLQGQIFMPQEASSPFLSFDRLWNDHCAHLDPKPIVICDFHAEATSEKEAFGHYADGRATVVYGTHTHVPTADAKVLPGGSAYMTDLGKTGLLNSVIGFEKNSSIKRFLNLTTSPYLLEESGKTEVNGAVCRIDPETKKVLEWSPIREVLEIF